MENRTSGGKDNLRAYAEQTAAKGAPPVELSCLTEALTEIGKRYACKGEQLEGRC